MNSNFLNKNLVIFLLVCGLGVGAVLVYAKNNMAGPNQSAQNSNFAQTTTQPSQAPQDSSQVLSTGSSDPDTSSQNQQANNQNTQTQNQNIAQSPSEPLPTGPITQLIIKDIVVGSGPEVKNGDTVEVHYTGTFLDGTKFDSSLDRGQPFSFTVGAGNVIRGWEEGLIGMKTGGKRQLIIPSDLAYGAYGAPGAIPPNTPLAFEIQLIAIK